MSLPINYRHYAPNVLAWVLISALTVGVSFEPELTWRYLLDMHVYIQGAEHFWTSSDLYDTYFPTRSEGLPFTYPPFGAVVFTPLWLLSEVIGQTATERVLTVISVVALWMVARTLASAASAAGKQVRVPVVLAVLMCSLTVLSTLDLGQVNTILMALVIADVGRLTPRVPLGVLTGIAAAIKLTPLVFGLYFLLLWFHRRQPQGLLGMGAGFFGATALAWLLNPADSLVYWTQTLTSSSRIGEPWFAKNVSLRGMLSRFPDLEATTALWAIMVIVVIILVAAASLRLLRSSNTPMTHLLVISLVSLISLLCSPVSWHHHWVWLGTLAVCLWCTGHRVFALWAVFAQTFGAFHMFLRSSDRVEFDWTVVEHILSTHYLWFSLILLLFFTFPQVPETTVKRTHRSTNRNL